MGHFLFVDRARVVLALGLGLALTGCVRTTDAPAGSKDASVTQSEPDASPTQTEKDAGTMGPAQGGSGGRGANSGQAGADQTSPPDGGASPRDSGTVPEPPDEMPCDTVPDVVDKVDLLFAIDNSGSMNQEQTSLRAQFPRLVQVLTSGDLDGDGEREFPPATDLHLGVVSSDLGLPNIQDIEKCTGLGDDGIMQNAPSPLIANCMASYPRFLTYQGGVSDAAQTAQDFGCIAALGTDGCGFEQQLESALKALWPARDNRVTFLGDATGVGNLGQGDGPNAGFLRNDPLTGRSLIAVIVVSDEEDCSSADLSHFTPMHFLEPTNPLAMQDLNLRCFFNPRNLYPIQRYVNGFKALREDNPALVVFGAIVGVPPALVSAESLANYTWTDAQSRDAFYTGVLDHPDMQERIDTTRTPQQGANLIPSCSSASGIAYPPRRIVQTARAFGENGMVQSICSDDFSQAMDAILSRIGTRLRKPCM